MSHHGTNIIPILVVIAFIAGPFVMRAFFGGSKRSASVTPPEQAPRRAGFSEFAQMARQLEAAGDDPEVVKALLTQALGGAAATVTRTLADAPPAILEAIAQSETIAQSEPVVEAPPRTYASHNAQVIAERNAAAVAQAQGRGKHRKPKPEPAYVASDRPARRTFDTVLDPLSPIPTLAILDAYPPLPVRAPRPQTPPIAV